MAGCAEIGVGLIGLGVVGQGVAGLILERADYFRRVLGVDLDIRRVAVRNLSKPRAACLAAGIMTDSPHAVIDDPDIQIVVEVMGGIEPAHSFCLRALNAGKDIVTANKALLAEKGNGLFDAAARNGVGLAFEASVCGGIPIVRSISEGLTANRIESLHGILNGTTNYVLTRMTDEGGGFDEMLRQAQEKGYAEADPAMDIDGIDAAQKLSLLCRLAFRVDISAGQIPTEGISRITPQDIQFARELGCTIKLLAIAKAVGERIEARVHPALIPSASLLANIKDEFNAVQIVGNAVGPQIFCGRGAGQLPTASAVVSDLLDLAQRRLTARSGSAPSFSKLPTAILVPPEEVATSSYCRFTVHDRPGVLAQIARIFAAERISIATVIQHGRSETEQGVPLIMTTHEAPEAAMRRAVTQIDRLPVVTEKSQIIRTEQL